MFSVAGFFTIKRSFMVTFFGAKRRISRVFLEGKRDTSVKGGHSGFIVHSAKQVSTVGFLISKAITLTNLLTFMPIVPSAF